MSLRETKALAAWALLALLTAGLAGCGDDGVVAAATDAATGADSAGADAADVAESPADAVDAAQDATEAGDSASDAAPDASPADVPPATCSAEQLAACDDGLACTTDGCALPGAVCSWQLQPGFALIAGVCRQEGEVKAGSPCLVAAPATSTKAWVVAADGTSCDDGDACTFEGQCAQGQCQSQAVVCDDGQPCTADVCDKAKGCTYPPAPGPCDDGSACTSGDGCQAGACVGAALVCNDGNPCTDDGCVPTQSGNPGGAASGCTVTANTAPCSDGNGCTAGDLCQGGQCQPGGTANCDDGNTCTFDLCDPGPGCVHLPTQSPCCIGQTSICDDGNPCTSDLCDPKTGGCSKAFNSAVCSDGNACTDGDGCKDGACAGKTKACNDGSACTADACDPAKGCVFSAVDGGPCDDGSPCTSNDVCQAGKCQGSGQCACTPTFSSQASKLTSLLIGKGGQPGEGLDLDENPKTCAPSSNCTGGIDNAIGALAGIANPQLEKAVAAGSLVFVLEYKDFKQGPIQLAMYTAELEPKNATCDGQTQTCAWLVDPALLDPVLCTPVIGLPGTLVGNALQAGGKGSNFPFSIPLQGGVELKITIYGARLQGTVALVAGKVTAIDAILAGAVPKAALLQAIDALPEEGLPVDKALLKTILESTVETDVDSDGDGVKDAASIALKLKGIPAVIAGVQ